MSEQSLPVHHGFDAAMAGKRAECDGGGPIQGTYYAARQEFTGTLTGEYIDHGDPPWRWYLMVDLVRKPAGYPWNSVWCEQGNLFLAES
ncbi:MAG: hypothetical protein HY699_11695 [Deltaproteobacteria bacterium]|nr:hypothetical protein [Deltaproteobacteria bacterium]